MFSNNIQILKNNSHNYVYLSNMLKNAIIVKAI